MQSIDREADSSQVVSDPERFEWAVASLESNLIAAGMLPEDAAAYVADQVAGRVVKPRFLTREELVEQSGFSARTFDKLLTDRTVIGQLGAWKTSSGRMAHWRFPLDAPERLRALLRERAVA